MESFVEKLDNRKLWGQVGSDEDWKQARKWAKDNSSDILEFSWDIGFKLDYGGEILKIWSRFYPPHKTGNKYTGQMGVYFLHKELYKVEIYANSLDELAEKAKAKANELIFLIDDFLKSACEAYENQQNDFTSKKVSKAHDNLNEVLDAEILYRNLQKLYKEIASRFSDNEDFSKVSEPLKSILEENKQVLDYLHDYSLPY